MTNVVLREARRRRRASIRRLDDARRHTAVVELKVPIIDIIG
jgi:hypothetical protein